jgi:hypothetical protein
MAYTVRGLEDSANWMIVTKHLRAKVARVIIDDQRHLAHFSFWKTDGSRRLIDFDVRLDVSRKELEKQIAAALA